MKYIHWGGREDCPSVSRLGFGTTRFLQTDLQDKAGLTRSVALVEHAIEKGINYFDVAPTYSNGLAEKILGLAFQNATGPVYVAAKTGLMIDKTAQDALRRIDASLRLLKKDKLDFYHIWSVLNEEQYREVCRKGGLLEGVLQARSDGLVDHVCISLHCDPETALRIMDDGIFEGITISLNALNYLKWLRVLEAADAKKVAVSTMNSLAGGMIPQHGGLFAALDGSADTAAAKALRFVLQLPGVHVALSGMPTKEILDENCAAVDRADEATSNFHYSLPVRETLCSGCNYCAPCTVGIPISACMQAYNYKVLAESSGEAKSEQSVVNDVFIRVRANGAVFPELKKCIGCRVCERRCTQKIGISERMRWLEEKSRAHGYENETMKKRLAAVEQNCRGSQKIAIWPAADYASRVLDYWGNRDFEARCVFVNASPAMWGREFRSQTVLSPDALAAEGVDTVVIMHHRFQEAIAKEVGERFPHLKTVRLHEPSDIDWFNRMI